jgi:hypothetical protein
VLLRVVLALALALLGSVARAAPTPAPAPPTEEPAPPAGDPDSPAPAPAPQPQPRSTASGVTLPPSDMIRDNSLLLSQARAARDAAVTGACDIVVKLGTQVRELDPTFHDQLFARDPTIAACLYPGKVSPPPPRTRLVLREVRSDPPPAAGRILGEVLLGMVVGAGGALVGGLIGNAACIGSDSGDCDPSLIGGAYIGYVATIPLGTAPAGRSGGQTGSLGATYLGVAAGGVGGLLMLASGRENIAILGMVLAPPLGAMVGFNATRRYKPRQVPVVGALISWSAGAGASIGVPLPVRVRSEDRLVTSIPLLGGTF